MTRQIVALLAASVVFWPMRCASASYCAFPVVLANGRIATVGGPERATGVGGATIAAGLPAVKYHAAAAPTATSSTASAAAAGTSSASRRGLRLGRGGGLADLDRVGAHGFGDVFQRHRAEVGDRQIKPSLDLPIGVLGQTDRPRLADALQPRGDIDAVAHQVAVALLDHVAEMDADPKFDALVGRDPSVALDHRPLDFNGAVHRVDDTAELDDAAVAGALDDATMMHGDGRIDQVAAQRPQPRQNPVLVGSGKPRIADHVGHQDRGEFSGLAHGATPPRPCQPFRVVRAKPLGGIAKTREEYRSLA